MTAPRSRKKCAEIATPRRQGEAEELFLNRVAMLAVEREDMRLFERATAALLGDTDALRECRAVGVPEDKLPKIRQTVHCGHEARLDWL